MGHLSFQQSVGCVCYNLVCAAYMCMICCVTVDLSTVSAVLTYAEFCIMTLEGVKQMVGIGQLI